MRSDPAGSPNREPQEKKRWVEPVTALLMALATLSTAWCSYHSAASSRSTGNVSGQYLADTVLFATVLFFASASGKFEQRRVRVVAFAFAVAVFLFAVVRTAMLPR